MSSSSRSLVSLALILIIALLPCIDAHTWIEQMSLIGSNGSYTAAAGYPRGYIARTDPGFNGFSDLWLLPALDSGRTRIDATDLLCHPAQRIANQTQKYPILSAAPGSGVAFKYLENGHVSLPNNQKGKPTKGGTVFVYGTKSPKSDEKILDVMQWTSDGNGGDKRGRLLTAQNYDDDRCHQINSGSISTERQKEFPDPIAGQPGTHHEQWCETDVILPKDIDLGTYTIYWVWDWPTAPGKDPIYATGKDEFYTTCADINVVAHEPSDPFSSSLDQQDPQMIAVGDWKTRSALAKAPYDLRPANTWPSGLPRAPQGQGEVPESVGSSATASASSFASSTLGLPQSARPSNTLSFAQFIRPSAAVSSDAAPSLSTASSMTLSATVTGSPVQQAQTLTALLTIVATLAPGQDGLVATGPFTVTFNRSPVDPPQPSKRSAKFRA